MGTTPVIPQIQGNNFSGYASALPHDAEMRQYNSNFIPQDFVRDLLSTPEAGAYANVEGTAKAAGVNAIRGGEAATITSAKQQAANAGLGRGFAQQQETNIKQQGTMETSNQILAAKDEENSRRYQQLLMLTQAQISSNKSRLAAHLAKKAQDAQNSASILGTIGNIFGSVVGAGANLLSGGMISDAIGAAAGGAAKSDTGVAADATQQQAIFGSL